MALVYNDDTGELQAAIWDGGGWVIAATTKLSLTMSTVTESQAFEAAYEQLSGDLIVAWGNTFRLSKSSNTPSAIKNSGPNSDGDRRP